MTVAFHVPDGKEGQQVYVTESGDTETNVPKPLGAEILHANGYGTASDPRASCSINMWLHSWPVRGKGVNSVMVTITLAMYTLAAEFT